MKAASTATTNTDLEEPLSLDKKFLSSNEQLFMNCFSCTTLPSPPNIPVSESVKITNYSERDRYYKIANDLEKLKKIIFNDTKH
jgi:hypothetical protein